MKKISFKTWILIGISLSLTLVFLVGYSSYKSLQNVSKDQDWVARTEKVISRCESITKLLIDAETGQRGFLLTKKIEFLEPYKNAFNQLELDLKDLDVLVADNSLQVANTEKLKVLIKNRITHLAKVIETKKSENLANSLLVEQLVVGKTQMDAFRSQINKIINIERDLLVKRKQASEKSIQQTILTIFGGSVLIFLIILVLFQFIRNAFATQLKAQEELNLSNIDLERLFKQNEEKTWLISGSAVIDDAMRGVQDVNLRTRSLLDEIARYVGAEMGVIYLVDDENSDVLIKSAGYAFSGTDSNKIAVSEGLIGQVANERNRKIWDNVPEDYFKIKSGLGSTKPKHLLIEPILFQSNLKAVMELAFLSPIPQKVLSLLDNANSIIGVGINASQDRVKMKSLIKETQYQAEELESQQEELKVTNEELIHKTEMLQASEEELRVQQEELRESNTELEERAKLLSEKNRVIEEAREAIVLKMEELEISGRYKSEFLANMSHELRTPLNSILILARILKDNKADNLSAEEEKYANVIFKSGNDLLQLINDILDLAKIESGKIELVYETIEIKEIADDLKQLFAEVAKSKDIKYHFSFEENLPQTLEIDRFRTEQILKNLLSNAFKFTPANGEVKVSFTLNTPEKLKIEISDTGIGVSEEKQKLIFDAFQQADGSTSREFGGTGLGLSISKELAKYMGGEITLSSVVEKGSEFSLIIPLKQADALKLEQQRITKLADFSNFSQLEGKINTPLEVTRKSGTENHALLVVEDDKVFSDFLKNYGENKGFEVTQIYNGEQAFDTALNLQPDAILLDVMLPGIDGWKVLKLLKSNTKTAHIPVHIMSAGDQRGAKAIQSGALSFIKKPIDINALDHVFNQINTGGTTPSYQNILLVEDHQVQSDALAEMFRSRNINVQQAFTGAETLALLKQQPFDCLILDLHLPDVSGIDLLEQIKENEDYKHLPVIINTAMELDQEKTNRLLKYSDATVMKSTKSSDRILDEVNLFLHQVKLQEGKQKTKTNHVNTESLKDKIILLVDDDMRNIFALSAVLDGYGFKVEIANDGEEALVKIEEMEKLDLVLMDIMMPKMDGYETMKAIRQNPKWSKLPIIALTAKAMKEDRDLCITAGANDYITKPVDVDKLLSLIKVWLAG
ncbi:response regulator [Pedobacter arcticus]|uniref:response regulator n=1 Tax=Pedobacter arcticus TaxID=752140 RepID=UPI0002F288A8|nr:response regulator [Pedobacter arcticus]